MTINVARVKKIEDILICTNDTDCNESIDLTVQNPESYSDSAAAGANDTEETTAATSTETSSAETTLKINSSVTEQPEQQSTTTVSSTTIAVPLLNDNEVVTREKKEICECDLIVCTFLEFY